jgi:hypothetical protein
MLLGYSCVEPFTPETEIFEETLVIDARLTDEFKHHEVFISKSKPFEIQVVRVEENALVSIVENELISFEFEEISPGRYRSKTPFAAKEKEIYQLFITTSNGRSYASMSETMPDKVPIGDLQVRREISDLGVDGIAIVLSSSVPGAQPRFFRYDYEETYKIVAPKWDPFEFEVIDSVACTDGDAYEVGIKPKISTKGQICYGQKASTDIILTSTADLTENTVADFLIRFIGQQNFILSHRYSIMVKQYSQSVNAHSYYENLESFSSSESVFSDVQPGFLMGNIFSETNENENVIGYFETASVSSKRIFFDYEDFFPDEPLPDYPSACEILGNPQLIAEGYHCTEPPNSVCDGACGSPLIDQIQGKTVSFAGEKEPADIIAPFYTVPRACGDCTVLGSDIKPDFWIE